MPGAAAASRSPPRVVACDQEAREQGDRHDEAQAEAVMRGKGRMGPARAELAERAREAGLVDVPQGCRAGGAAIGERCERPVCQPRGELDAAVEGCDRGRGEAPDATPAEHEAGGQRADGHGGCEQGRQNGQDAEQGGGHPHAHDRRTGSKCGHQRLGAQHEGGAPARGAEPGGLGHVSRSAGMISSRQSCSTPMAGRIVVTTPRSTRKAAASGLAL